MPPYIIDEQQILYTAQSFSWCTVKLVYSCVVVVLGYQFQQWQLEEFCKSPHYLTNIMHVTWHETGTQDLEHSRKSSRGVCMDWTFLSLVTRQPLKLLSFGPKQRTGLQARNNEKLETFLHRVSTAIWLAASLSQLISSGTEHNSWTHVNWRAPEARKIKKLRAALCAHMYSQTPICSAVHSALNFENTQSNILLM